MYRTPRKKTNTHAAESDGDPVRPATAIALVIASVALGIISIAFAGAKFAALTSALGFVLALVTFQSPIGGLKAAAALGTLLNGFGLFVLFASLFSPH
jgi:hypothetical protein